MLVNKGVVIRRFGLLHQFQHSFKVEIYYETFVP